MKTELTTDGRGGHKIIMEPENAIEKLIIQEMSVYSVEVEVSKKGEHLDTLILKFQEPKNRVVPERG